MKFCPIFIGNLKDLDGVNDYIERLQYIATFLISRNVVDAKISQWIENDGISMQRPICFSQ